MFCPQCGHRQEAEARRFCSRCGLALDPVAAALVDSRQELQNEKREVTGLGWMTATVLMLFNFLLVFGLITLPYFTNPVYLILWLSGLAMTLTTGGIGLAKLMRGGFFRRLKERELRLELVKADERRQAISKGAEGERATLPLNSSAGERPSVTEGTTRRLQESPGSGLRD